LVATSLESLAPERVGQRGEVTAFCVHETEPAAIELSFENAVFLLEIGDDLLLVPLEPASNHDDEHVQNRGVPRVASRDVMMRSSILPTGDISTG
jgi:hypothetical protein